MGGGFAALLGNKDEQWMGPVCLCKGVGYEVTYAE